MLQEQGRARSGHNPVETQAIGGPWYIQAAATEARGIAQHFVQLIQPSEWRFTWPAPSPGPLHTLTHIHSNSSRKICYCTIGAPGPVQTYQKREVFLQDVVALENLLSNSRLMLAGGEETVEVLVPRLAKDQKKKKQKNLAPPVARDSEEVTVTKKVLIQRKVTVAAISAAEACAKAEQARKAADAAEVRAARQLAEVKAQVEVRGEGGVDGLVEVAGGGVVIKNVTGEALGANELLQPLVPQVVCGLCSLVEAKGSAKAERMLSCQTCKKQYHRKCIKHWAEHRDLFNWASWICASCRSCEVCKRMVEPNKLMFCKRCDAAYHVYCQQPPLKHVPKGPFLCPKHTRCHSCASHVPGSGVSSRWFLTYTTCDACGRLFMKGKYCPVCLKVYRDSEATPMVCCDSCEHWVHCSCDGISDEKYQQYQVDDHLKYKCAACRGECHRVIDLDDAMTELWRRRDVLDAQQRAELRAASGLPSQEEMLKLYPSSDDDRPEPLANHDGTSKKVSKKLRKGTGGEHQGGNNRKVVRKVVDGVSSIKVHSKATQEISKLILRRSKSEKSSGASSKKSKKEGTLHEGEPQEGSQGGISNNVADVQDKKTVEQKADDTKTCKSPVSDGEIATEVPTNGKKKKKKKKHKGGAGKLKCEVKAGDSGVDEVSHITEPKEKLKGQELSGSQEVIDRDAQGEMPGSSVERLENNRMASMMGGVDEGSPTKAGDKEKMVDAAASVRVTDASPGSEDPAKTLKLTPSEEKGAIGDSDCRDSIKEIPLIVQEPQGNAPLQAWGGHSESARRRRMPSSKYRDMDTSIWRSSRNVKDSRPTGIEEPGPAQVGSDSMPQALEVTEREKGGASSPLLSEVQKEGRRKAEEVDDNMDKDDSLETPRKRLKVADLGGKQGDGRPRRASTATANPIPKVPLRLKIRKQPSRHDAAVPASSLDSKKSEDDDPTATRGQRSKRKRSGTVQKGEVQVSGRHGGKDSSGDDSWILQKLGTDAIAKRVEVFWPMDDIWYKGTVVAVTPQKLQFAVHYDDGEEETLNFGKEKVRLLSSSKRG